MHCHVGEDYVGEWMHKDRSGDDRIPLLRRKHECQLVFDVTANGTEEDLAASDYHPEQKPVRKVGCEAVKADEREVCGDGASNDGKRRICSMWADTSLRTPPPSVRS